MCHCILPPAAPEVASIKYRVISFANRVGITGTAWVRSSAVTTLQAALKAVYALLNIFPLHQALSVSYEDASMTHQHIDAH